MVILSLSCRKQQEPQSIAGYIIDTTNSNQIILFVPDSIPAERSYVVDDNTLFSGGTVMEGNIAEAESIMADLTEPISLLFREGNPTGIKSMTAAMGITRAEVRLPLVEGSDTLYHDIKSAITKYELR